MKAVYVVAPMRMEYRETPDCALLPGEVRIEISVCSVCGSDLKNIARPPAVPYIPGHEFAGRVVELCGTSRADVRVGTRVTVFPMFGCLACDACRRHDYRDCSGKRAVGFNYPGAFAERIVVPEQFVIPLLAGISDEQGALLEHLCCGLRLAREVMALAPRGKDARILIIGDGPIALADIQALRQCGFCHIALAGKHELRMATALRLGAVYAGLKADLLSGPDGQDAFDVCILAAAVGQGERWFVDRLTPGAIVFPHVRVDPDLEACLQHAGFSFGRAFGYLMDDFVDMMAAIEQGTIVTQGLVTDRVLLRELPDKLGELFNKSGRLKTLIIHQR